MNGLQRYPDEAGCQVKQRRLDVTLRQNIDEQISNAELHLQGLLATKERMEASNLLDMRIEDLQVAMRF